MPELADHDAIRMTNRCATGRERLRSRPFSGSHTLNQYSHVTAERVLFWSDGSSTIQGEYYVRGTTWADGHDVDFFVDFSMDENNVGEFLRVEGDVVANFHGSSIRSISDVSTVASVAPFDLASSYLKSSNSTAIRC